jgi:hypothetical protein
MADVDTESWTTFVDGQLADADEVNGNFTELRNLITTTKLDHDNLQFPKSLHAITFTVVNKANHVPSVKFYARLPDDPDTLAATVYEPISAFLGLGSYDSGDVKLDIKSGVGGSNICDQLVIAATGVPYEETSFSIGSIMAGATLEFALTGSSNGGDQITVGLYLKTKHFAD